MNKELAKTLTTALVQFIDRERPEGTMCCSNYECEKLEKAFEGGCYDVVESLIKRKLSGLSEFEQGVRDMIINALTTVHTSSNGQITSTVTMDDNTTHLLAAGILELAKQELLSYADESNPKIEAMADLERTFECNPEKLPQWLKDKLGKKHLEGYIMGREDTMREMKDFIDSHFNCEKAKKGEPIPLQVEIPNMPAPPSGWGCDGTHCTNPQIDCINCPRQTTGGVASTSTSSGTSTLKAE